MTAVMTTTYRPDALARARRTDGVDCAAEAGIERQFARLQQQLVELRARIALLEAATTSPLRLGDRDVLARLLPAVVGQLGSSPFLASEAVRLAAVQVVIPGITARRLGKLLKRATNLVVDDLMVQRMATEAHAVVWQVVGVPEFPSSGNSGAAPLSPGGVFSSRGRTTSA